ncbi:MAG TPA: hypothetical protein VN238_04150, partial [Solirubrobacteraceae bacterium]|nr:hypothetical protein [Solirubrobacteraceae bacterium]
MASAAVTDPEWIAERRSRAAEMDVPLPAFKGQPGWEFTELRKFDLGSFPAPADGDLSVEAERVFSPPSLELRQVDNA